MDFINSQRRRQMLITAWQEYLKDIDLYIGAADTGVHAQTGHPVVVVQMAFGVRPGGGGGGRWRSAVADAAAIAAAAPATPPPPLNPQPICTQIAGNLYNDDIILSVAHKYQINTKWLSSGRSSHKSSVAHSPAAAERAPTDQRRAVLCIGDSVRAYQVDGRSRVRCPERKRRQCCRSLAALPELRGGHRAGD